MKKRIIIIGIILSVVMTSACGNATETVSNPDTEIENPVTSEQRDENEVETTESDVAAESDAATESEMPTENETATESDAATENEAPENEDYYAVATSFSKSEVEDYAISVKQMLLQKDWDSLSENIAYPIKIGDTTYQSRDELLKADWDSVITDNYIKAIEAESCQNMFCNWQGIMFGSGEIWISEILNEDGTSQGLKITAMNVD